MDTRDELANQSNTSVCRYFLPIASPDIFVINTLLILTIHPVERTPLGATIKVLDVTHHSCHFDTTFNSGSTTNLHLSMSTQATPETGLTEASNDNGILMIN